MRPRGRNVDSGKTLRRSAAKVCVGPDREGWWEVVMRSLGVGLATANSSLARSASKSGSWGSVMMVSSYSRLFSRVAGMFVFSRS